MAKQSAEVGHWQEKVIAAAWMLQDGVSLYEVAHVLGHSTPVMTHRYAHLRGFRKSLLRRNGMAMLRTILAEEHRTPELLRLFRDRIVARRRQLLGELIEQGVVAGDIRPRADIDAAVNLLVGSFYARYLAGQAISDQWPERAVAMIWPALAAKDSAA